MVGGGLDYSASFQKAIELIGKRWTGAVVKALLPGPARFNQLLAGIPGISDRVLTERLRELETESIVERLVDPGPPVRVSYRLTSRGRGVREGFDSPRPPGRCSLRIDPTCPGPRASVGRCVRLGGELAYNRRSGGGLTETRRPLAGPPFFPAPPPTGTPAPKLVLERSEVNPGCKGPARRGLT